MAINFSEVKVLASGDQIRITEAASPDFMKIAVKIGAGAFQVVTLNQAEATDFVQVLQALVRARINDPS
jgi:hypothetical protein